MAPLAESVFLPLDRALEAAGADAFDGGMDFPPSGLLPRSGNYSRTAVNTVLRGITRKYRGSEDFSFFSFTSVVLVTRSEPIVKLRMPSSTSEFPGPTDTMPCLAAGMSTAQGAEAQTLCSSDRHSEK